MFGSYRENSDGRPDYTYANSTSANYVGQFGQRATYVYSAIHAVNEQDDTAMGIQADGKIVVASSDRYSAPYTDYAPFVVVRQNPNGSNDTTFNFSGTVNTRTYPNFRSTATSLAIQADGKIVVAGHDGPHDGSTRDFAVVRYNPNGSLDTSFDGDGIARVGFVGYSKDYATGVKIQSDGKIVLAGYSDVGLLGSNDIAVARLNTTGSLDNTFGTGGRVTTSVGFKTEDIVNSLVIQADGKIVVAGKTRNSLVYYNEDAMLVRYNTNGSLDSSFGISGVVTTEFKSGNNDGFKTVTIQNGRILAAGYTTADTSPDFYSNVFSVTLARYYQ